MLIIYFWIGYTNFLKVQFLLLSPIQKQNCLKTMWLSLIFIAITIKLKKGNHPNPLYTYLL
jgi:hypothetical protein